MTSNQRAAHGFWSNPLVAWTSLVLGNVLVSFVFVYLVRFGFDISHQAFPSIPEFPDGPWPDVILFVNIVGMAFLLEIAVFARKTILQMRHEIENTIETGVPAALEGANMGRLLNRLFPDRRSDSNVEQSGEQIIGALRRFSSSVPESQRAFVLWLVSRRLPNELHTLAQSLQGEGLVVSIDEEIEAERFLAKTNRRFLYIERAIPENYRTAWTEGWLEFLPTLQASCPEKPKYYFATTRDEFLERRSSFLEIYKFLKSCGIDLHWCDTASLRRSAGIDHIQYSAIASYSEELGLVATGVGKDGDWCAAVGKITIRVVEMNGSQHARRVLDGILQYSLDASEVLRTLRGVN